MVAEPVFAVSHQTRANCTNAEPTSEKACPPQMVKNLAPQRSGTKVEEAVDMAMCKPGIRNQVSLRNLVSGLG
jgi:hypothetical protein